MRKELLLRAIVAIGLIVMYGCRSFTDSPAPVELTWEAGVRDVCPGYSENTFVLHNISDSLLGKDWAIYFCSIPFEVRMDSLAAVCIEQVNSSYYKMYPTKHFIPLLPGDSLRISYFRNGRLVKNSHAPEGTYWVQHLGTTESAPQSIKLTCRPLTLTDETVAATARAYERNLPLLNASTLQLWDILPSVKEALPGKGELVLEKKFALDCHSDFFNEGTLLKEKLKALYGLESVRTADVKVTLDYLSEGVNAVNEEFYTLDVTDGRIAVRAATAHGMFNGTQTLLSMLKGQKAPYRLKNVAIRDYPDLLHRGQMLDISRNFTSVENVKKLIDIWASYKLNTFQFHFSDDEGWRLEIPGLEELTTVGARRGHTHDEQDCMYPAYDCGYDSEAATTANGYYTRQQFMELLCYAAERHIDVIPEIETPGHSRAAIAAMKSRYYKYIDTAPEKACEYLASAAGILFRNGKTTKCLTG